MVTSMIPSVDNIFVNKSIIDMRFLSPYNPLINYDWSTTTAKEYKTDGVELVTDFSRGVGVLGSGITLIANGTGASWSDMAYVNNLQEVGAKYICVCQVLEYNSGRVKPYGSISGEPISSVGTYEYIIDASTTKFAMQNQAIAFNGMVQVSVQKVIQEPNKRYLKDVGSTPTYDASMYFGRGAYLNGVDQTITVPINTTIQTALKRVNGVVTINETSQTLTNYVISGLGVHKDYYLFTRLLTTAEKDSYTNTPELFYAMAQSDSTCVLNMPMCETDGYARNMKSYSEGSELVSNANITDSSNFVPRGTGVLTYTTNNLNVVSTGDNQGLNASINTSLESGKRYAYVSEFDIVSGSNWQITAGNSSTLSRFYDNFVWESISGNMYFKVFDAIGTDFYPALKTSSISGEINIKRISVFEISGIHPITNYTTSVRDNAKNLQYGLQTCKFVRDSLGVIQSASDYLVCNGTGYAIIPSHTDTVNIKMTVNPTSLSGNLLSGGVTKTLTGLTLNVDNDVVISNVTPTGAITLASGFSGTIKTYTEELV